ncbi:hypothetical protein PFISCL1PPCAC_8828, partial [Pristionchus fissidentatus]
FFIDTRLQTASNGGRAIARCLERFSICRHVEKLTSDHRGKAGIATEGKEIGYLDGLTGRVLNLLHSSL